MKLEDIGKDDPVFLQRLLRFGGFSPGEIDGIIGPKTKNAIARWCLLSDAIASEYGSFDERTEENIRTLVPNLQKISRSWLKACSEAGLENLKIYCGTRTYYEQKKVYAQGRTLAGKIVTKAKAGQSMHNFGVAFDFAEFSNGNVQFDSPEVKKAGEIASSFGLEWGGNWSFYDPNHLQLKDDRSTSGIRKFFER